MIGRNDKPGRFFGAGGGKRLLESLPIGLPISPFFKVLCAELPMLVRVVKAREQALFLLVFRDVEKKLQDACAVVREHLFEIANLTEAVLRLLVCNRLVDPSDQHIFVMGAVKNADESVGRAGGLDTP